MSWPTYLTHFSKEALGKIHVMAAYSRRDSKYATQLHLNYLFYHLLGKIAPIKVVAWSELSDFLRHITTRNADRFAHLSIAPWIERFLLRPSVPLRWPRRLVQGYILLTNIFQSRNYCCKSSPKAFKHNQMGVWPYTNYSL